MTKKIHDKNTLLDRISEQVHNLHKLRDEMIATILNEVPNHTVYQTGKVLNKMHLCISETHINLERLRELIK